MALVHTMRKASVVQGVAINRHCLLQGPCEDQLGTRLDVLLGASLGKVKCSDLIVIESIDLH